MEPYEYQTLFEFESFYWWYKALHLVLLDTLESLGLPLDTRILDAGCGTGQNLANIVEHITSNVYGFDLSEHAAAFWSKRNLERMCVASINEIPFASKTFQAVVSIDVMECEQVKEAEAYSELWRVLKPGGYMVLVVPAYDWLIDKEHHRAVRAVRRYSKSKLLSLLSTRPMELMRITHLFGSVLPAVACRRFASKLFSGDGMDPPRSDLKPFNPILNHLLFKLVSMERRLVRKFDIPFGSSIMAVARKIGE
ncbi:MAG TPA: class I SAM-dependent methyltransferase [Desulfomonilaceae bacterium]|nr:class I SAM-dependent methyltransferase [Desulfomonilaceae bacterium]